MTDPILTSRLDVLKKKLDKICSGETKWWDSLQFQLPDPVLQGLDEALRGQARDYLEKLNEISDYLMQAEQTDQPNAKQNLLNEAWNIYTAVYNQCQEFFDECLEIIGGLAFRDRGLEDEIYQVADELIKKCAFESSGMRGIAPTVPALPKTLIKTLARIIGLRFPEWTIWDLPFTAHELGHVVINQEGQELKRLIEEQAKVWGNGITTKWSKDYLDELWADAFATYTMGPAYACAVIVLRFNPLDHVDEEDHPNDAKRAHVVFTMLKRMNDEILPQEAPYYGILKRLRNNWLALLRQAGQPDELDALDTQRLKELVDTVWEAFGDKHLLLLNAKYSYDSDGAYGWLMAEGWYRTWCEQLKYGNPLDIQDVARRNTLRDVLNAAWRCRLKNPDRKSIEKIEKAAQTLCEKVIRERAKPLRRQKPRKIPKNTLKLR